MAAITATALKTTLEAVTTYPYTLRFFTAVPKYPIYPYVTIRKIKPQGTQEDFVTITKTDGFEVKLHIRYTRDVAKEEEDQTTVENSILTALEAQDFGTQALFSESKTWQRQPLQKLYGSTSTIMVTITDIISKSGSGIGGHTDKIELNAISGETTGTLIQILRMEDQRGTTTDAHLNDAGVSFWDPISSEGHSIQATYESTTALDTIINTAADLKEEIQGRLQRGNVTTNYLFLVGRTTKSGQFDNIERATTTFYVAGTWAEE